MQNLPNPPQQYSKHQTRDEEIEKCIDGGLEPTYYFRIFNGAHEHLYLSRYNLSNDL